MQHSSRPGIDVSRPANPQRPRVGEITARQIECLYWAQQGKSAGDIGAILEISPRTVEGHIARTCELLGVRTRIQAIVLAKDLGLFLANEP